MKKIYRIVSSCICILLFMASDSRAQNNLSAGDLAFVSYQSDKDLSNTDNGGTTPFTDRFAIIVLKSDGLAAGTVLYFTDNGWNANTGNFISGLSEGFIKWEVPAGGIAFNTRIYFISTYINPVMSWGAYTNATGTTTAGAVATMSGSNYLELSTAGDQVLAYQTGPASGPAGAYNDATRRFITAIHANFETTVTTSTSWDGNNAAGGHQSSLPPGLTNGVNAFLMTAYDNGKYIPPNNSGYCLSAISPLINTFSSWMLQNNAFSDYSPVGNDITPFPAITISSSPASATLCNGLTTTFHVSANNVDFYFWEQSTNTAFTSPVTLTNTGVYRGTYTADLSITDISGLGGRYYRAIIFNTCEMVTSDVALLSVNSATLPTTAATLTQAVNTNNNLYYSSPCTLISKIVPSGASPLTGNVTGKVWVESAVPTYNNQPFVARHYQVTPATGASTATGTVTLYFTQAEFNAFNAAPGSALDLPTGPTDNTGKTNLRVGKYAGSSNDGSGLPGSYTSGGIVIDPADANIIWNANDSRWEITFDVTGFSGFIIQTSASVLPVNLMAFTGQLNNNDAYLQWKTAGEIHHDYFDIERSTDGQTFTAAGRVAGTNESTVQNYTWIDAGAALLSSSKLYYRLKMVSTTAEAAYSNIVIIPVNRSASPVVSVTPNPFTSQVKIGLQMPEAAQLAIRLTDITGKLLKSEYVHVAKGYTVLPVTRIGNLEQGIYILSVTFNGQAYTFKIVK